MRRQTLRRRLLLAATLFSLAAGPATRPATRAVPPAVGDAAPPFTLQTLDDKPVALADATKAGPVILVVLRGWPGYQCPVCTKQVNDLVRRAEDFAAAGARVVLVYPGPAEALKAHAAEFAEGKGLPAGFTLVMDPDYAMVRAYGLRWDAPGETAYPSSFVIDPTGIVRYAKISASHGGRATPGQILEALKKG